MQLLRVNHSRGSLLTHFFSFRLHFSFFFSHNLEIVVFGEGRFVGVFIKCVYKKLRAAFLSHLFTFLTNNMGFVNIFSRSLSKNWVVIDCILYFLQFKFTVDINLFGLFILDLLHPDSLNFLKVSCD
jgi:hypothetical protein